jgi:hypothetical protein
MTVVVGILDAAEFPRSVRPFNPTSDTHAISESGSDCSEDENDPPHRGAGFPARVVARKDSGSNTSSKGTVPTTDS